MLFLHSEFRQDMGGVGGFIRENRTLYVGRIAITSDTEDVVRRQFGQFGPLERGKFKKQEADMWKRILLNVVTHYSENIKESWSCFCDIQDKSQCRICKRSHDESRLGE